MANKKILVVDDERPLASALKLKLTKEGFDVDTAYNGEEALGLIDHGHYDLILLDLVMPEKDGFYVLEKIQNLCLTTPVIVSSNLSQEEDMVKAKGFGAVDYFVKSDTPISVIIEKVKAYIK